MGTFRFPLEPLLEQAKQQEAHARKVFDTALVLLESAREELAALERAFDAGASAARAMHCDARSLKMSYGCTEEIARRIEATRLRAGACAQSCDDARARVLHRRALRKTLEMLKSRQLSRHRQVQERLEERALDEVNAPRMTVTERP
ncbi:MAG: hypothetical protein M3Z07_02510 [Candidatus Eremiobacteraeota bacterium]|nr:hypothetical protein [Candidatus Eremiobacteraeota bacterium]